MDYLGYIKNGSKLIEIDKICDHVEHFITHMGHYLVLSLEDPLGMVLWIISFVVIIFVGTTVSLDLLFRRFFIYYKYNDSPQTAVHTEFMKPQDTVDAMDIVITIHFAIIKSKRSFTKCVKLLEKHGRELMNIPIPPHKYTAFLRAVWSGPLKLVKYMLNHGACIELQNDNGESAMYLAVYRVGKATTHDYEAFHKKASLLNTLFKAGCDINTTNYKGFSPLHIAAKQGNYFVTLWLLKRCANPNLRSVRSLKRPIDIALQYSDVSIGHMMVANLLQNFQTRRIL